MKKLTQTLDFQNNKFLETLSNQTGCSFQKDKQRHEQ